jgi:hypothetical protein
MGQGNTLKMGPSRGGYVLEGNSGVVQFPTNFPHGGDGMRWDYWGMMTMARREMRAYHDKESSHHDRAP